jgi:BASS family bile acid:Na+ symporter
LTGERTTTLEEGLMAMKKVCALIGKYFGFLAIIFLLLGLVSPDQFKWVVGR